MKLKTKFQNMWMLFQLVIDLVINNIIGINIILELDDSFIIFIIVEVKLLLMRWFLKLEGLM